MSPFSAPLRAVVRGVPETYAKCLRTDREATIHVAEARAQHAAYVDALRGSGITVEVVAPDDACPDSCFIEDTAVVLGRSAVLTQPGAPSRRAEVEAVGRVLTQWCELHTMTGSAMLDGGDVLRHGSTLFVGLSSRTNSDGLAFLASVAKREGIETVPLSVPSGLHLKSACSLASPDILVHAPGLLDEAALATFREAGLRCVAAAEPVGANVLLCGSTVLVSEDAPRTAALLRDNGLSVKSVRVSEFHKGDGALTCLSLRLPVEGAWCT